MEAINKDVIDNSRETRYIDYCPSRGKEI